MVTTKARIKTCKWLATFSLVIPSIFISSSIFFGTAPATTDMRINLVLEIIVTMSTYEVVKH